MLLFLLIAAATPQLHHGPDTCVQGFVWRDAFAEDHVCVVPATREQARRDNAAARYRVSRNNPPSCRVGYVWREAKEGDVVCVTPDIRAQTRQDNAAATERYVSQ